MKKVTPQTITILVDRRERLPWTFPATNGVKTIFKKATLKTGDYSLPRQVNRFTIERKSAPDLINSCTTGHARFRREHDRLQEIIRKGGFACVIVEASFQAVCAMADKKRPGDGNRVFGTLTSWLLDFKVPWIFAGSRVEAQRIALDLLLKQQTGQHSSQKPKRA